MIIKYRKRERRTVDNKEEEKKTREEYNLFKVTEGWHDCVNVDHSTGIGRGGRVEWTDDDDGDKEEEQREEKENDNEEENEKDKKVEEQRVEKENDNEEENEKGKKGVCEDGNK